MRCYVFFHILAALACVLGPVESRPENGAGSSARNEAPSTHLARKITIGTFNIKMFPCGDDCACMRHEAPRFRCRGEGGRAPDWNRLGETILTVAPDILAVNEILNPERLQRFAREHLGKSWRFVYAREGGPQKVGFLYNSDTTTLKSRRTFTQVFSELDAVKHADCVKHVENLRPAFACRFGVRDSALDFILAVVHLKSGPCHELRLDQWRILENIADSLLKADREVMIVGDFNDRGGDKREFGDFCENKRFHHISGSVECTYLYSGKGRALDGFLASESMKSLFVEGSARVGGPCAAGCKRTPAAEAFRSLVSDHCPVVAQFAVP
jgi:predicted extracellular nuclease